MTNVFATQFLIKNARIVTEDGIMDHCELLVQDQRIKQIAQTIDLDTSVRQNVVTYDAEGAWLLPGFIDIHVHGGFGGDFMTATPQQLDHITHYHALNGTTGMLATSVTQSREATEQMLQSIYAYQQSGMKYAQLLGVHLEGPFISEKWCGAQNPAFISPPQTEWLEAWVQQYPQLIRIMTLAAEKDNALPTIQWLKEHDIIAATGHSDATYEEIIEAIKYGMSHAVHTFNAMTPLHHRNPGTVGAVLSEDSMSAEVIADGIHVHPAVIRTLSRSKPADKLILITDAIAAAGLGDGQYDLGGLDVIVKDEQARLAEGNSLAGSTLSMIKAFRFVIEQVGFSVEQASQCASGNPAKLLGISEHTGSIATGKDADLLLVSADLQLQQVWIRGHALNMMPIQTT